MAQQIPQPPPAAEGPGTTVVLVILALGLFALAGWMGREFYQASAASSWPTTEGVVRKGRVREILKARGGAQYQADVAYDYVVDGRTYSSVTFNTRNNYLSPEAAPAVAQQYATGARCTVHYNPGSPGQSVIDPARTWHAWGKLTIGVVAAAAGVAILVVAFRKPAATGV